METASKWQYQTLGAFDAASTQVVVLEIRSREKDRSTSVETLAARTEITRGRAPDVSRQAARKRDPPELLATTRRRFEQAHTCGTRISPAATKLYCGRKQALKNGVRLFARICRNPVKSETFARYSGRRT